MELSPRSSNEDWTQWEIVDVEAQSQQVDSPQTGAVASPKKLIGNCTVPIHENVQSQSYSNNDEEKDNILHHENNNSLDDLQEQYRQQQKRLQQEQKKCLQLTREVEKSMLFNQNNNNGKAPNNQVNDLINSKKIEYDRIITENQTHLKQLEIQKEESQRMVEELIQANEEMKKKLDDICQQRDHDKQYLLRREEEYIKKLESNKEQQLKSEIEKEAIKKEKELIKKEKEQVKKDKEELLLLKKNQTLNKNKDKDKEIKKWTCTMCHYQNKELFTSCQSCTWNRTNIQISDGNNLLIVQGTLNDITWKPCEEQEYGWILQNNSNKPLKFKAKLQRVAKNVKVIAICEEEVWMMYEAQANNKMCVVVNARAPALCGEYNESWQMITEDNKKIGPVLEMKLVIKSDLKENNEEKVRKMICDLGFKDRDAIVAVLIANQWDVNRAAQHLASQQSSK